MKTERKKVTAALVGCPNVGKSTLFNALTGMKQRTGNWAGVTVSMSRGEFDTESLHVELIDLPGTYSLTATSPEEEVTRAYILENRTDCVICVLDACAIEKSLALALEVISVCDNVILVLNLTDEAKKRGITVDSARLQALTGKPVIETAARSGLGIRKLSRAIGDVSAPSDTGHVCAGCRGCDAHCANHSARIDENSGTFSERAAEIAEKCCSYTVDPTVRDRAIDRIVCGKFTAPIVMLSLLSLVLWLTLTGSSYISDALSYCLGWIYTVISDGAHKILPYTVASIIVDGAIGTALRVIAVMLPPMAIFFPLFAVLEDLGYLPRVSFCLDRGFACCGACGKQSLTMMMGLGCNAAGVTGCRIIESKKERDVAIITNSLIPCNGRFPIIITALSCLGLSQGASAASLAGVCIMSVLVTLAVSKLLSVTLYRGEKSFFTLELPPYRPPQILRVTVRSLFDKCTCLLLRAVTVSIPAGAVIWLLSNTTLGGESPFSRIASFLDPIGRFAGMDGTLLLSFILALPAAELMLPIALSASSGSVSLFGEIADIPSVFVKMGWSGTTVVCVIIFTVLHFPCATTLCTVYRETRSIKTTLLSFLIPTVIGYLLCVAVNLLSRLIY